MTGRITICLISGPGSGIRQASVSRLFLVVMGLLAVGSIGMAGAGFKATLALKGGQMQTRQLKDLIDRQRRTLLLQRSRIQWFAGELDRMGERLAVLKRLETKVRVMADLEDDPTGTSRFGVGGPAPAPSSVPASGAAGPDPLGHRLQNRAGHLARTARERSRGMSALISSLAEKVDRLAATPSIRPVPGWTTSGFGYRASPFTGRREFHRAMDIANRAGTPILATADGVVVRSGDGRLKGNRIVVDHGHGMVTVYAHAEKLLKDRGDRVRRGETIALMGSSGRSTGPHLHYEVHLNGVPVDPEKYILN
jgi:murein DD-endopeptidase MepM/ murein hydrolase activator NlpD